MNAGNLGLPGGISLNHRQTLHGFSQGVVPRFSGEAKDLSGHGEPHNLSFEAMPC